LDFLPQKEPNLTSTVPVGFTSTTGASAEFTEFGEAGYVSFDSFSVRACERVTKRPRRAIAKKRTEGDLLLVRVIEININIILAKLLHKYSYINQT
jgi:hypothetical protein